MLVRVLQIIFVWVILFFSFLSPSLAQTLNSSTLNLIKKHKLDPQHFSFYWAQTSGPVLIDHNSQVLRIPASITKIITASAILSYLPPGTKFKTFLSSRAKIENGILKGDLFLVGGGDPSFVSEKMWFLVNNFVRTGIREIEGNIIVDDSLFDRVRFDSTRESSRVDRAYDAPVGAMSFNWNSMNVFIRPGQKNGDPALVFLDPENEYLKLNNKVKTVSKGSAKIDVDRSWNKQTKSEIVTVKGTIGKNQKEHVVFANVTQPELWAGANLISFLAQRGIKVKGEVVSGKTPASAEILAESESKPIEMMLADMNKFSNNFVAEMLTKNLSVAPGHPATLAKGISKIQNHLKELGFTEKDFKVINPSGLTRDNKSTAYAMWKLLTIREKDFSSMPEFLNSLPISGVDGTLKNRMKQGKSYRQIRAKTGWLKGVVSLAGYASDLEGHPTSFAFIYNGPGDQLRARDVMDQIFENYYSQR